MQGAVATLMKSRWVAGMTGALTRSSGKCSSAPRMGSGVVRPMPQRLVSFI